MNRFDLNLPQLPPETLLEYPEFAALQSTRQDPVFHAEGDVWTHTLAAAEALKAMPAWQALDPAEQFITYAAILFHDIGKPATTRVDEDGRIRSPGHAAVGAKMARSLLYRERVPFDLREAVCGLVRWHALPPRIMDRDNPEREAIRASMTARTDLLLLVVEADARGRASVPSEYFDAIGVYHELASELEITRSPYRFFSHHTRFRYFQDPSKNHLDQIYDDTRSQVTVLSGLPAVGKDHWIAERAPNLPVVSLDQFRESLEIDPGDNQGRVIVAAREKARSLLRQGSPFVWNATNTTRLNRERVIRLLADYNARIHIVYLEAPWQEILRRNKSRAASVPAKVMQKLLRNLEVPDQSEAHQVTYEIQPAP
jgi:putative nucleotidyltransferase with HDIG domain